MKDEEAQRHKDKKRQSGRTAKEKSAECRVLSTELGVKSWKER
jgi:hypothetical protein